MLTKKEQRKEKTREAIKQAALQIAATEGWQGVTIRKIADHVLYTPPIVYEFFKNKDALYHQLVQDGFTQLTALSVAAVEGANTPETKLLRMLEARFDFATQNSTLHHLMFDADNSSWHAEIIIRATRTIKDLSFQLLVAISGQEAKAHEYFLNLVCLVKGYTFFEKHLTANKLAKVEFLTGKNTMKTLFIEAIQRFIDSIKSN